ncbi:alpha/beta fold hydrolase [Oceaniglobus indicus]|uniref:alpha/beta fold hydrolase n=1 Tax=Oceaniglobus indicus TaxID=2047749 RepID=UPI000C19BE27|nr:alpha/beta hydrolase [Oceaniglobus indicus]
MPLDTRAGFRVFSRAWGSGRRRALALHCALGHSGPWEGLAQALPLAMTAFDLPGHGQSADWPGGGDYHVACTDIAAAFCDGPTDLIGHSFGATVALRLAVERPDLVRTLTLIEPVFFAAARADHAPEIAGHDRAFAPFVAAVGAGDPMQAARAFTAVWGGAASFDSLSPRRQQAMADRVPLIVAGAPGIEDDSGGLLTPGRIEGITAPVLLVRGGASPPVIGAVHRALMARLSDASETIIPKAGHMVALTHPERIAAAMIRRFTL